MGDKIEGGEKRGERLRDEEGKRDEVSWTSLKYDRILSLFSSAYLSLTV